jgi:hypothetical protein
MRITTVGLSLVTMVAGAVLAAPVAGATVTDTAPPSVPQNLRSAPTLAPGDATVSWDASVDDSGSVWFYWVLVDGQQRAKPAGTSYNVKTLVNLGRITPGTHTVTVLAVDRAANRSAQSNAIQVTVS